MGRHLPDNSIQVPGPMLRVVQGHLGPLPLDLEVVVGCLEGLLSVGPQAKPRGPPLDELDYMFLNQVDLRRN